MMWRRWEVGIDCNTPALGSRAGGYCRFDRYLTRRGALRDVRFWRLVEHGTWAIGRYRSVVVLIDRKTGMREVLRVTR
jgi:hypothetical protein